jgi:hypothetical protein
VGDRGPRPPAGGGQRERYRLHEPGERGDQGATPPGRSRTASTRAENSRSPSPSA